ncbi:hypothetical protein AALO_G00116850 [Alosa alosa]|uniref:Uncharacterized protein n=1 Tax=Alosa alosa TaxID=278164 RepID=A0AAV6GRS5_9TELE|nr:hypothetical protein AALO_G00116850 [Alosa alosa]
MSRQDEPDTKLRLGPCGISSGLPASAAHESGDTGAGQAGKGGGGPGETPREDRAARDYRRVQAWGWRNGEREDRKV